MLTFSGQEDTMTDAVKAAIFVFWLEMTASDLAEATAATIENAIWRIG